MTAPVVLVDRHAPAVGVGDDDPARAEIKVGKSHALAEVKKEVGL
jgi:hypothetical protein